MWDGGSYQDIHTNTEILTGVRKTTYYHQGCLLLVEASTFSPNRQCSTMTPDAELTSSISVTVHSMWDDRILDVESIKP